MTKSHSKAVLRKYKKTHPWAKKLPKSMTPVKDCTEYPSGIQEKLFEEDEARRIGDGSWAIVYDESREGEWLWELADNGWVDHVCSVCRYAINIDFHVSIDKDRCPRCGALMVRNHGVKLTNENIIVY